MSRYPSLTPYRGKKLFSDPCHARECFAIESVMRALRENCVVLDTSVLPKRPGIPDIKKFLEDELRLDMSQVKCIQPHNIKNVVYLAMASNDAASRVAALHHLNHCMEVEGRRMTIPIYVESSTVDVRLHDLPYDMENVAITDHMRQYGEVISIRDEVWKSYFPGFSNGVRVVKMKLKLPIPSYITVGDEITLVTYHKQMKTCRNCGRQSHPKKRCSEVVTDSLESEARNDNTPTSSNTSTSGTAGNKNKNTNNTIIEQSNPTDSEQWPALQEPTTGQRQQKGNTDMKRQRSIESDTPNDETKKQNTNESDGSDVSLITVSSNICPYTKRPYRIPEYLHILDENERRSLIEEDKRRIDAAYLEIELNKKKKKKIPN